MSAETVSTHPLLEAARALYPRIRAESDRIEADRCLSPELVRAVADAGLFRMAVPIEDGGGGADLMTVLQVIEEIARADGSTGWCLAMGINTYRQSAQFSEEARRLLFWSDPVGVSAGSANPRGIAVRVQGGYRVTGHWFFASGCMHSSTLHGACRVYEGDTPSTLPNGLPENRIAYFHPKEQVEIVDTWSVTGLRGTGSHDIVVNDLFVPEEHTFSAADRRARVTGPVNAIPSFDLAGCNYAAVALGIGRSAIETLVDLAATKTPRASDRLLRERPSVQAQVGEAEALLRSARAFLFDLASELWQSATSGQPVTPTQRADLRLAMTHASQSAVQATRLMNVAAGTTGIFQSSPLERITRDAEVAGRHYQVQSVNYEAVGRSLLGLESTSPLF